MENNKIAFSVDLDDWYHTPLISGADFSPYDTVDDFFRDWNERFDYVTEPSMVLLDLMEEFGVKATFFVIADEVERYPELMKRLKQSDHEIAHHSLHHTIPFNTKTKLQTQTNDEWEDEFVRAKQILTDYFQTDIIGYRAPGAYFADWMVPILINHGIQYDSSVVSNSVYNKSNRDLDHFPKTPFWLDKNFNISVQDKQSLLEIPWVSRQFGNFYLPGGGAFFFRLFGYRYFKKMYQQHLKLGDGVFYIHSLDLSNEKFPLSNFRNRPFYWVNKGDRTIKNLRKLLTTFSGQFCTCSEILNRHSK
jgi:peptidoglycan/xylan/chitin deacetylase (PgdA/CDA1 family)